MSSILEVGYQSGALPFKRCACGRAYTRAEWDQLKFVGMQECAADPTDPEHPERFYYESRNCLCGSTMLVADYVLFEDDNRRGIAGKLAAPLADYVRGR